MPSWIPLSDELGNPAPILLLTSGLIAGFAASCCTLYIILCASIPAMHDEIPVAALATAVTNIGAFTVMIVGFFRKSVELRNVAVFVMAVGGLSVLLEILTLHGVARLVSVFSFGIAAALASGLLAKWPAKGEQTERD